MRYHTSSFYASFDHLQSVLIEITFGCKLQQLKPLYNGGVCCSSVSILNSSNMHIYELSMVDTHLKKPYRAVQEPVDC